MKRGNKIMIWSMIGGMLFFFSEAPAQDISQKAEVFLNSLSAELKASATFPFDNSERFNWHFIPRGRKGPTFHDFNEEQTNAAIELMKASLSEQGFHKAQEIFELENILRELENRPENDDYRDPLNYHFTVFGTPSKDQEWGWRLEGHHLSLNFSSKKGKIISATPTFYGSNPAVVPIGIHRGKMVLEKEMKLGFKLIQSFDNQQIEKARYSEEAPYDILTGNDRKAGLLEPMGIAIGDLDKEQEKMLLELLELYVHNYSKEYGQLLMQKVKDAGIEQLYFAWAGSLEPGTGHYYRIQNPAILIEYDNTQNDANHIHTVVRDLTGDFGEDVLGEHYRSHHF